MIFTIVTFPWEEGVKLQLSIIRHVAAAAFYSLVNSPIPFSGYYMNELLLRIQIFRDHVGY